MAIPGRYLQRSDGPLFFWTPERAAKPGFTEVVIDPEPAIEVKPPLLAKPLVAILNKTDAPILTPWPKRVAGRPRKNPLPLE